MSKILRRPMFRGGPVDSRGTGITANLGYQAGGRVGYKDGTPYPTGAQLKAQAEKNLFGVPILRDLTKSTNFIDDAAFNYGIRPLGNLANMGTNYILGTDIPMIEKRNSNEEIDNLIQKEASRLSSELIPQVTDEDEYEESYSDITERKNTKDRQIKEEGKIKVIDPNDPTGNTEQSTQAGIDDIKAQAELFRELLSEGKEERIKKARIGDASDYLLKFFEGSQKEGATVGSAAADVAGFATSKDSRTEKARAANEKVDQTATALAINDYIAGKRSREQTEQFLAKSDLALGNKIAILQMAKEDLAGNITEAGKGGSLGTKKLIDGIKNTPSLKGKGIETFSSKANESVQYEKGYENQVFIDTDTETIFTFDSTGTRIPLY